MRDAAMRPAAVLFDCDGVLADSEALANQAVAANLTALGWPMTPHAARETFLGMSLPAMVPVIEKRLGRALPADWPKRLVAELVALYDGDALRPVPGAPEAVAAIRAAGIPMAVASNSGREELRRKAVLLPFFAAFEGRIFCFEDVARAKPFPDMYLAAARACGAPPTDCVVVEDSPAGVRAGVAAGCRVIGVARESTVLDLLEAGASETLSDLSALPGMLGLVPA
ncbi:HAD family hydrolase [Muricoccus radiodurans]|uniref:HAD family hydrolase n=1 Tax=Muricoccus radiodurans TaxID=2231721 RepID=UPI003CF6EE5E